MSVSILVVDDEPDVADLFRQRFRREARDGTCVIHSRQLPRGADRETALARMTAYPSPAMGPRAGSKVGFGANSLIPAACKIDS
jgi:hypothetical protein